MAKKSQSFFEKIFSIFLKPADAEADKKRRLKAVAKSLSKSKYRFYKSDDALPAIAKFFYLIYRDIFPAKAMFMAQENPNRFKMLVVSYSLSEAQHALIDSISEEGIKEAVKKKSVKAVRAEVEKHIEEIMQIFTTEKIFKIESLYRKLMMFRAFCTFDFFFLLKKFNSNLHEGEFGSVPTFDKIPADYISDDLKDFIAVAWTLPEKEDWSDLVEFFKDTKGTEPVTLNVWHKTVNRVVAVKNSQVIELFIRAASKDPDYVADFSFDEDPIVDNYLDKIRNEAQKTLDSIQAAQQSSKIGEFLNKIFGTTNVDRLTNYTAAKSATFERKNLGAFDYVQPLNYYKAFLLDYVKKELREFADLVLVRGTWSTQALSSPMSNAYHSLIQSSEEVLAFDAKIADDASIGIRIKNQLPQTERSREARNIIGTLIGDLNDEARELCVGGTKNLIVVAKTTKTLIEDYEKPHPEVIINWKELEHFAEHPIKELAVGVYKQIYLFVNLMQNCLSS